MHYGNGGGLDKFDFLQHHTVKQKNFLRYISNISTTLKTLLKGMGLSFAYLLKARRGRGTVAVSEDDYYAQSDGIFTLQYPHEEMPVPDHGRYKLHNEIEDCIVCDKCAKICPVDCIDIVPIRAPEAFGQTSNGTPLRIHAAKFDIDMAKCCFCGLCTVVCPTECLTMTKEYDFSTTDILSHNFSFSKMSEKEISEKKSDFAQYEAKKAEAKAELPAIKSQKPAAPPAAKPVFRPRPLKKK